MPTTSTTPAAIPKLRAFSFAFSPSANAVMRCISVSGVVVDWIVSLASSPFFICTPMPANRPTLTTSSA